MDTGRAIVRGTVGPLFIGHGVQKLFGWFGGHGLDGTGAFFEQLGMRPGRRHAAAAGAAEAVGGAMITLGLATPVAAAMLTGVMTTAVRKVHAQKGIWASDGGFEYNAVLVAALAGLVEQGPGRPSVDAARLPRFNGPAWVVVSLGAGIAGSFLNEKLFNQPAVEPPPPPAPAPPAAPQDAEPATDGAPQGSPTD